MIPLEDFFNDVVGKAQRGLAHSDEALASAAGIAPDKLRSIKDGEVDETALLGLAGPLELHGPALVAMAKDEWTPRPIDMTGLAQFNTTYHDMTVNAYVVWDPASRKAAVFDTGADATPIVDFVRANDLTVETVFITHTHGDHIADLERLKEGTGCQRVLSHALESVNEGETFEVDGSTAWTIGALQVEPRRTHGHSKGGITYVIRGLAHPVAIVGDALFASSMGGGMVSYADALATNRKELFSLADETIIGPGHGPLTTLLEEKQHNPFYPEFK